MHIPMTPVFRCLAASAVFAWCAAGAQAATVWDEATNGDLSGDGSAPTLLVTGFGSNLVFGDTGGSDYDIFSIEVPVGAVLSGVVLQPGTTVAGGVSFLALEAGGQFTQPLPLASAVGLLGWTHYDEGLIGVNLLPSLGTPRAGSTGFAGPLPVGSYTFFVQDTSGSPSFGFDLQISPVPEPGALPIGMAALGLAIGVAGARRRP